VTFAAAGLSGCGAHHPTSATHTTTAPPRAVLTGAHPCPGQPQFTCSTLRVPLDHAIQAGGTLALAVGMAAGRAAPRGDLLFLTGGPGQPGIPFLTRIQTRLHDALAGYRLVMFDQRGTGAGALRCPALQKAAGASDLTVVPQPFVETCARSIGAARRYYATAETVADIERLRVGLGARRLNP
jgi:pimeloyl-ACP methyl ester carboxylesterase